jgi:signal transduction histidine kinase/CheY-like chemotaxis protein
MRPQAGGGDADAPGVSGTLADVTDRAALRDQRDQTARLEVIGRLAGGVAHDVNNVLTTIQVQADALEQSVPSARGEVRPIHEAVARGALLTRQLLSFGRRQQVTPVVLDIASALRALEGLWQRMAGPDLRLVLEAGDAAWARADALQLEQVVGCFVANARDASPAGSTVRIEVETVQAVAPVAAPTVGSIGAMARFVAGDAVPPGRWTIVRVRDDGVGIDDDAVPRLFEPFFTTKGEGRTGLGLAAVYCAVRQVHGVVRLASTPGIGTTAEVFLPAESAPAALPTGSADVPQAPPGTRVLLVEDEPTLRLAVRRMLERRGAVVVEAPNGRDALAALEVGPMPDIVISDVVMPELDGRAFVREAERRWPGLRVLFISGYTAADAGHATTMLDGRPLLQKPFTAPALYAAIDAMLAR